MPPTTNRAASRTLTDFLLADIVAIAADAIICIDEEQRITLFNEGAERIFGWTAEEMIGQPLELLLPERFRESHHAHVERFRSSPDRARKMGQRREIAGLRKNGQEFPAEAAIAKVTMGNAVVFSVVLRDITEEVALQKRLQAAVSARDDTVSVVAHDLRNPVSAVKMLSAALQESEGDRLTRQGAAHLRLIAEAANQMDRLIQDLLDVTRIETGRLLIDPRSMPVHLLVEGALQTLRPLVQEAGLRLDVSVPRTLPAVQADAERIAQVLSNLVGNAIKATARGGRLAITANANGDAVSISVADTGHGITQEQLPHIFDRFWQSTHSTIRSRGAGLGLAIAQGIVRAHGGRLWAESEVGTGSTFHFTVPLGKGGEGDGDESKG